jgi:hypothetical protein
MITSSVTGIESLKSDFSDLASFKDRTSSNLDLLMNEKSAKTHYMPHFSSAFAR